LPELIFFNPLKTTYEPGETASILIGSSEKISVLVEVEFDEKIINKQVINLNNTKQIFNLPIKEEYRGNIAIHYSFAKNNRL